MDLRAYIEERSIPIPFAGCWMWLQSLGSHGYGNATLGRERRVETAPRVAYRAFKGPITPGAVVQHSCDSKWCVNPDHLSLGTHATNALDKQVKGRAAKKLSPDDVRAIRALSGLGVRQIDIARRFAIDRALVAAIFRNKIWRHV